MNSEVFLSGKEEIFLKELVDFLVHHKSLEYLGTVVFTALGGLVFSVGADPDPGSGAFLTPGSGAFLTPGSGMGKKSGSGIRIRNEQPGSYFRELRNHFLG